MLENSLIALIIIGVLEVIAFAIGTYRKNNSVADVAWGIGFFIIAVITFFFSEAETLRKLLVTVLVIIWGLRLTVRIFLKNYGSEEDRRYAKWREKWGKSVTIRSFFQVYLLQGVLLLLVSLPIIVVNTYGGGELNFLDYLGFSLWLIGFFFESVGDYELDRFIFSPENKGKIMKDGLWRYSRHPNYFGESLMWIGLFLISLSVPYGWAAIISPILITFLLLKVSGVPMAEARFSNNPEFLEYKEKTNTFFPWFPKT